MNLYQLIKTNRAKISVIGLGYVGLPLAIAFAKKINVIGFDIDRKKIESYKKGVDITKEVGDSAIKETTTLFTCDEKKLREAKFHIVAVPTPVNKHKFPDLSYVIEASKILGKNLTVDSIVVYESTVYPGVTEEICIPILEKESGLKCREDFKVGYSPERINPGSKVHTLENVVKIVSGIDEEALDIIANVYELIVKAGVYKAKSIKVAEAAKLIENTQRDINIALVNELSIIFNKLGIDTKVVLDAAATKWNFFYFTPGLVGGHCICVDPYYLTFKANSVGYYSHLIQEGRKINDNMVNFIAEHIIKSLVKADIKIKGAKVAVFGITFKENCSDIRNTKVIDLINELKEYGIEVKIVDPVANPYEVEDKYGFKLHDIDEIKNIDAIVFSVPHKAFLSTTLEQLQKMYRKKETPVLIDLKGIFSKLEAEKMGYLYWRL